MGNRASASVTVHVNNAGGGGDTPPTVAITAPSSGAKVSGTIAITATAGDDAGVANVVFQVDSRPLGSPLTAPPYSVSLNTTHLSNGQHLLTSVATNLTGHSSQASVIVTANNSTTGPTVTLSPATLSFGAQVLNTTSKLLTVTLANGSSTALNLTGIVASGDFAETNTCSATLNAGANCVISVTFTPTAVGIRNGALTITDNSSNSPQAVQLTGIGATSANSTSVSPTLLSFGTQTVGATGAARTVTLSNSPSIALSIASIAASGDFAETNTCSTTLNAGANCAISVTFTPTAVGIRNGALTITDNSSNSPRTVQLTGSGSTGTKSSCTAGQWCEVLPNGSVSRPADNGWNLLIFSHDTGKFYLYANSGLAPTVTPWENAFWSYVVQGQPATSNPWVKLSDCGDTSQTIIRQHSLSLAAAIGASDSQLSFNIQGGSLEATQLSPIGDHLAG